MTIDEIRKRNKDAGGHFFDRSTMRFFRSRISTTVYGDGYFISSEQNSENGPRLYTVRRAMRDGGVETASGFGEFVDLASAEAES